METKRKYVPYYDKYREYESPIHIYRIANYLTSKELSEKTGVNIRQIYSLANGSEQPVYEKDGSLKSAAKKLCDFFKVGPAELFPRYICKINRAEKFDIDTYITFSETVARDPCEILIQKEYISKIISSANLTKKEFLILYEIIRCNNTLRAIGKNLKTTPSNVGQIFSRAIRKIRYGIRKNNLDGWSHFLYIKV
ncbi:MAG: hypothetical protein IJD16_07955 [Desulfovibrio sp.]|nr:hypothetical protein [Desulfovibrio sp.]